MDWNKPWDCFQLRTSWCPTQNGCQALQPAPGCPLCQEVAPLIHVSSKEEGYLLISPKPRKGAWKLTCLAAASKPTYKIMMLMFLGRPDSPLFGLQIGFLGTALPSHLGKGEKSSLAGPCPPHGGLSLCSEAQLQTSRSMCC